MKLYLIRHAESYGNIRGKIISSTDFKLTEKGIAQSQRIGQKICLELKEKPISAYCSSLARAKQTLIEILRCIGQENAEIIETDLLKEMNLGLLEGMTWEERRQKYPEIDLDKKLSLLQVPYGESYQDVKNRCKAFTEKYLEKETDEKNILIVSHGITLRILINFLLKRPDEDINFLNWLVCLSYSLYGYACSLATAAIVRLFINISFIMLFSLLLVKCSTMPHNWLLECSAYILSIISSSRLKSACMVSESVKLLSSAKGVSKLATPCICILNSGSSPTDTHILSAISLSVGTLPNSCSNSCTVFL